MEKFIINGGIPLKGEVNISGSKNACLPIMAATLLASGKSVIHNVPVLRDVKTMCNVLRVIGAKIKFEDHTLIIDTETCDYPEAPYELVSTMRASFLVMGPLLARMGKAMVSRPGGCAIGPRLITPHIKGFEALGVKIKEEHGYINARVKGLKGSNVTLIEKSVTATENILMLSTHAEGETRIINAALEPHVIDLVRFLKKMGARIKIEPNLIYIKGVRKLYPVEYTIIPDYIEAGTFMIAGAITRGAIRLKNTNWRDSSAELAVLRKIGIKVETDDNEIRVKGTKIMPYDIKTAPYPGFPTDLQPQFTSLLSLAQGTSTIEETLYESRFTHIPELVRMGADIKIEGRSAIINGVNSLSGAKVMASDIRAGAALVLAGLAAKGETEISRIYHIDRGYEKIEDKLKELGADIERV
jgi:UDP-N-acetylglucosamine 1-carboxyvinyltransferase